MVLRNAFAELAQEHSNSHGDAHLVAGSKLKWRREFNQPNATYWDEYESGITIPDPASGTITVNMGTTASAEGWLVSKQTFTFPVRIAVGLQLSQKIANNEVYVELVGCDESGALDETRVAAWRIAGSDSTTNTIGRGEVRNGGSARRQSGNFNTAAQTGAVAIMEIIAESDEIWFTSKASDNAGARTAGGVMNLVAPDPEGLYKLRIRFKNGATAPASATTVTLQFALALDYTEHKVEVTGGTGDSQSAQAIPVYGSGGTFNGTPQVSSSASAPSASRVKSAATTNATSLKTTSGRLYGYILANNTASTKFLKFYNKTSAPTVGTDTPFFTVALPPNSVQNVMPTFPIPFSSGIAYAITGAVGDADTTAVAVDDVTGIVLWV